MPSRLGIVASSYFAAAASTLPTEIAADTPDVWWKFQESTDGSTASDSSGNSRSGSKQISTGTSVLGAAGFITGESFAWNKTSGDGYWASNGNANDTGLDVGTGDYAYEFATVCTNNTSNFVQVCGRDSAATGNGQLVYLNTGTGVVRAYCAGVAINGTTRISDSAKHHVVVTRESGTLKIYVDGTLENSASAAGNVDVASRILRVGIADASFPGFLGKMAHFAYYKKALTSTRVAAHAAAALA